MKEENEEPVLEINSVIEEEEEQNPNKPTPEEVKAAEEEFKAAIEEWEKTTFELSPSATAGQNFIDYIRNYMDNHMMWTQNAWMGAIKLTEELAETEKVYHEDKEVTPVISWQALEFIIYILNNPGGIGVESAKEFEKVAEEHVVVLEHLERKSEEARKALDNIKFLQDKWAAYEQGFYYEKEPTDEEMPEGSYFDKEADRFLKPGDKGYDIQKFIEAVKEQYGEEAAEQVVKEMEKEEGDSIGPPIEDPEQSN